MVHEYTNRTLTQNILLHIYLIYYLEVCKHVWFCVCNNSRQLIFHLWFYLATFYFIFFNWMWLSKSCVLRIVVNYLLLFLPDKKFLPSHERYSMNNKPTILQISSSMQFTVDRSLLIIYSTSESPASLNFSPKSSKPSSLMDWFQMILYTWLLVNIK